MNMEIGTNPMPQNICIPQKLMYSLVIQKEQSTCEKIKNKNQNYN